MRDVGNHNNIGVPRTVREMSGEIRSARREWEILQVFMGLISKPSDALPVAKTPNQRALDTAHYLRRQN